MTSRPSLTTILTIFQQSEYDVQQVLQWRATHQDTTRALTPEAWTPKLRMIAVVYRWTPFLPLALRLRSALALTKPLEWCLRTISYTRARHKLALLRAQGLIVVAIAGSYGKTSTKEIMRHTLSEQYHVYATPKSINTKLGIAQCILNALTPTHTLCIIELGEYHPHDIPQLLQFVTPDYGVLTPIGRQHLDIIGGMHNIIRTFQSFIDFFPKTHIIMAEENLLHYPSAALLTYGSTPSSSFHISDVVIGRNGTECACSINTQPTPLQLFTPLYGAHQARNVLPSLWLARQLGASLSKVAQRFATQPYIHRRHEPTFATNNVLILDNSYNTNPDSIAASLQLVHDLKPARSFIITLGFVELGKDAEEIHRALGKTLAQQIEYVGLIDAPQTAVIITAFIAAGGQKSHIVRGKNQEEILARFHDKIIANSIILIEGGYQDLHL